MGCRRTAPAGELVRVVRTPDGRLTAGRTLPGRGAWLCAGSLDCLDEASRRRSFGRALRTRVDDATVAALRTELAERARMVGRPHEGS